MKVISNGVSIMEVPGLSEIRVEPDELSERGVHVVLTDDNDRVAEDDSCYDCGRGRKTDYGMAELEQLRDALTIALEHANRLAGEL
jgi:hypothetical protein